MGLIKTLTIGGETYDIQPAKVGEGLEVMDGVLSLKTDDSLRVTDTGLSINLDHIFINKAHTPLYISNGRINRFEFAHDDKLGYILPQLTGGGLCINQSETPGGYGLGLNVGVSPLAVGMRSGALVSINLSGYPFVPFNNVPGQPYLAWDTRYGIYIEVLSLKNWIKNEFGL